MTHRAEQIAQKVGQLLAAEASTLGCAVFDEGDVTLAGVAGQLPALEVRAGEDSPLGDRAVTNLAFLDSALELVVAIIVEGDTKAAVRAELMRLRASVHVVLMADRTLGLSAFVSDTYPNGAGAPDFNTDGERIAGRLESRWLVEYRANLSDPN